MPITGDKDGLKVPTREKEISIFTVKAITQNPTALSKFLAATRTQYKPLTASRVFYNPTTKEYFAYLNFSDSEISEKLQEIAAFPEAKRQ